ncbi:Uncharacterised protein [Vibrio cholerae]|uniref:Uncharacterized protein n=1 Tax=Vibrio cholerae TaxID=666 RepID=A0A655W5U3_VIBCL|nr:Uncharacterised protein [Vibrio cholerae]
MLRFASTNIVIQHRAVKVIAQRFTQHRLTTLPPLLQ